VPKVGLDIDKLAKMMLLLLAVFLLLVSYDAFLREKSVWVEKVDEERTEEVELKGWKKFYLGEKLSNAYIAFGLPRHYLKRGFFKSFVFLAEEGGEKKKLAFDEDIRCKDPDGNEITLRFYEKEPIEERPPEPSEENDISSIRDRIEGKV
jgi:hypothetical protein